MTHFRAAATSPAAGATRRRRNRPREIGTYAERAVERYLRANGFPNAEKRRTKGTRDEGDITGTPGICWEVKGGDSARNASDEQIRRWLAETERERVHAGADIGILVVQRRGIGPANAGRWWAIIPLGWATGLSVQFNTQAGLAKNRAIPVRLHLADVVQLLRAAGYGEPLRDLDQVAYLRHDTPREGR